MEAMHNMEINTLYSYKVLNLAEMKQLRAANLLNKSNKDSCSNCIVSFRKNICTKNLKK